MVNSDPNRTPTFTMFGNPDFFFHDVEPVLDPSVSECVAPGFAWNHGDIQQEIGNTWVGFVGPGVDTNGVDSTTWTDHTNLRPTMLALLGLEDDYVNDGHLIVQAVKHGKAPKAMQSSYIPTLEKAYEDVNASFGDFSLAVIKASTKALKGDNATYMSIESSIDSLTTTRDTLAGQIKQALNDATFGNGTISQSQAQNWINQANALVQSAQGL